MNRFYVPIGYTRTGRERRVYFSNLEEAKDFVSHVFEAKRLVLTIIKLKPGEFRMPKTP